MAAPNAGPLNPSRPVDEGQLARLDGGIPAIVLVVMGMETTRKGDSTMDGGAMG